MSDQVESNDAFDAYKKYTNVRIESMSAGMDYSTGDPQFRVKFSGVGMLSSGIPLDKPIFQAMLIVLSTYDVFNVWVDEGWNPSKLMKAEGVS